MLRRFVGKSQKKKGGFSGFVKGLRQKVSDKLDAYNEMHGGRTHYHDPDVDRPTHSSSGTEEDYNGRFGHGLR
jgi:hypothetical protein